MTNRERAAEVIGFKVSDELDDVSLNILTISIELALDEAEKRGAEKMRERAAKMAEGLNIGSRTLALEGLTKAREAGL